MNACCKGENDIFIGSSEENVSGCAVAWFSWMAVRKGITEGGLNMIDLGTGQEIRQGTVFSGPPWTKNLAGKRCFCSWSGGKDSCLALYRALKAGAKIEVLVNMLVEDGERSRSHGLRSSVIQAQARAMGVRLEGVATSWGDYEAKFVAMLKRLMERGLEVGIFGDIDLEAHLDWERKVCDMAGLSASLPLWQEDRVDMVREFHEAGFKTRIVSLRADSLPSDYLGQVFSMDMAEDFKGLGIDPCGENGEFHTVVTDGPCFLHPVELVPGERILKEGYWFLDFEVRDHAQVGLSEKSS